MHRSMKRCTSPLITTLLCAVVLIGLTFTYSFASFQAVDPAQLSEVSPSATVHAQADQSDELFVLDDPGTGAKENAESASTALTQKELLEQIVPAVIVMFLPPTTPKTPPPPPPPPPDDDPPPGPGSGPPPAHTPEPAGLVIGLVGFGMAGAYAACRRWRARRQALPVCE